MDTTQLAQVFPHLSRQELLEVVSRMLPQSFGPGEVIVRQGDPAEHFYVIAQGAVEVSGRNEAGAEVRVRMLGPGDFFGEIGLLGRRRRTMTCTAAAPTEVLAMDRATFSDLMAESAGTAFQLQDAMWERLETFP
jgi:CRP-like cAMP-binding protein